MQHEIPVKHLEAKVPYGDWQKLDLRIAAITAVKPHPNADKLYVLSLDFGDGGKKELVAGIKEAYKEDELIGKQIAVFVNLEPKMVRGVLSEGMILAASDNKGNLGFLTVDKKVNNNAKVF